MTNKWIEINDLSSGQYSVNKNLRFKTSLIRSDLCDYSDAYIVVKETITVEADNDAKNKNKKLAFKNNAPFRSFISKINNTFIENADDLDTAIHSYSLISGSLWSYYNMK